MTDACAVHSADKQSTTNCPQSNVIINHNVAPPQEHLSNPNNATIDQETSTPILANSAKASTANVELSEKDTDDKIKQYMKNNSNVDFETIRVLYPNMKHQHFNLLSQQLRRSQKSIARQLKNSQKPIASAGSTFISAIQQYPTYVCHICHMLKYKHQGSDTHKLTDALKKMSLLTSTTSATTWLCTPCITHVKKNKLPPNAAPYLAPPVSPACLQDCTFIEQRMISIIHPFMTIVTLPYQQQAIKGQIIHFPSRILEPVIQMPRPQNDSNVFLIQTQNNNGTECRTYPVNHDRIHHASDWLLKNNPLYEHVAKIPYSAPTECSLNTLDIESCAHSLVIPADYTHQFQTVQQYVAQFTNTIPIYSIPRSTGQPVNTYTTNHVEELSFPCLFPTGDKGYKSVNAAKLSFLQYAKTRILNKDHRWSSNPSYLFWLLNECEKHRMEQAISIAVRKKTYHNIINETSTLHNPDNPIYQNSWLFMKQIRGTEAYWHATKSDLLAKFANLGPPTFFLTLSANDLNWSDLWQGMILTLNINTTVDDILHSSREYREQLLSQYPVFPARHFIYRWETFLNTVLLKSPHPLGQIVDFFWRVEFQLRGAPHIHALLWILNPPSLDDPSTFSQISDFIDQYIKASVPSQVEEPILHSQVKKLQMHKHTHTCYTKKKNLCRFDFPQPISACTHIKNGISPTSNPHFYRLKRAEEEQMINAYNPLVLELWNANMDLQMIGSAIGAARYITTYLCKPETKDLLSKIKLKLDTLESHASERKKLRVIGHTLLTHRQVSQQEAVYRLCSLPLKGSSRQTVFVNTSRPDHRTRLLKPLASKETNDSQDLFLPNIIDHYQNRPDNELFSTMTLAHFATHYKYYKTSPKNAQNITPLQNNDGFIQNRTKSACLKTPPMSYEEDSDAYLYHTLLLYLPFKSETELPNQENCEQFFHDRITTMQWPQHAQFMEVINKHLNGSIDADDIVTSSIAMNPNTYNPATSETITESIYTMPVDLEEDIIIDDGPSQQLPPMPKSTRNVSQITADFSPDQLSIFNMVYEHHNKQMLDELTPPIFINVSGPAGTGKSHLLHGLFEYLNSTSDSPVVILTAPTGIAAHNIGGVTLHRALRLPVEHHACASYKRLSGKALMQQRQDWSTVKYLFIDEISMVSNKMLLQIHQRLTDTFPSSDGSQPFAGVSLLTFGDFHQLKPVMGKYVFQPTDGDTTIDLWNDNFSTFTLSTNFRQHTDQTYSELCNRFRIGAQQPDDYKMLQTRLISNLEPADVDLHNTIHIFPTNNQCEAYNISQLQNYDNIVTIMSIDVICSNDSMLNTPAPKHLIPKDDRDCAGLPSQLHIAVKADIILRRNIDIENGLVNGARGYITSLIYDNVTNRPTIINVHFNHQLEGSDPIAIAPLSARYFGLNNSTLIRTQFPIQLCFAATIHKMQGCTLPSAVLYLGKELFGPGMAYVALSRLKTINTLAIITIDPKARGFKVSQQVLDYYKSIVPDKNTD